MIPTPYSAWILWSAFALYAANMLVGVVAWRGWYTFGKAHHVLYFVVFAAAVAAAIFAFHAALMITIAALATMPLTRPHKWQHPVVAIVGFAGYCVAAVG